MLETASLAVEDLQLLPVSSAAWLDEAAANGFGCTGGKITCGSLSGECQETCSVTDVERALTLT